MPEIGTQKQPSKDDALEKFKAYSPLVKSLAGIAFGAFGDSPMSRGLAEGAIKSAQSDIERAQLTAEISRKRTEAHIKKVQEENKRLAEIKWKVASKYDDPNQFLTFLKVSGWEENTGVALPETFGDPEDPIEFDLEFWNQRISEIEDPTQRQIAELHKVTALNAVSKGNLDRFSIASKNLADMFKDRGKIYYGEDGKSYGVFDSPWDAAEAGFPFTSPRPTKEDPAIKANQRSANTLKRGANTITNDYFKKSRDDQTYGYEYATALSQLGKIARQFNMVAALGGVTDISFPNPMPELLTSSYMVDEAGKAVEQAIRANILPAGASDFEVYDFVKDQLPNITKKAAASMGDDRGYKMYEAPPPTDAPDELPGIDATVEELQGVPESAKGQVRQDLQEMGYTAEDIKKIFKKMGW